MEESNSNNQNHIQTASKRYLVLQINILKAIGLWNHFTERKTKYLYQLFSFLLFLPTLIQFVCGIISILIDIKHPDIVNVSVTWNLVPLLIKCYMFMTKHDDLQAIVDKLNDTVGRKQEQLVLHEKCEKRCRILTLSFIAMGYLGVVSNCLVAFIPSLYSVDREKRLTVQVWYPLDTRKYFTIVSLYQLFMFNVMVTFITITDTFLPTIIMHLEVQMQLLCISLRSIKENIHRNRKNEGGKSEDKVIEMNNNRSKEIETLENNTSGAKNDTWKVQIDVESCGTREPKKCHEQLFDKDTLMKKIRKRKRMNGQVCLNPRRLLCISRWQNIKYYHVGGRRECKRGVGLYHKECESYVITIIQQHVAIFSLIDEVKKVFSPIIFGQFLASSIHICWILFNISTSMGHDNWKTLGAIFYLTNSLVEIWLLTHFGSQLKAQSLEVAEAAYDTPWYELSSNFRRCIRLVMLRAQRPTLFTGQNIYVMSNETFTNICSASISYLSVLRHVNK